MASARVTGESWTAVVLAGGRSRRWGGPDKTRVDLHGRSLLDHILGALPVEVPVVVVGTARPTTREVVWCREEPEFAGPVSALATALAHVTTARIGLLAGDMPDAVPVLLTLVGMDAGGAEAVAACDADGRLQPLCSVLASEAVRDALASFDSVEGVSIRDLFARMPVRDVPVGEEDSALLADIDSPADLARARQRRLD